MWEDGDDAGGGGTLFGGYGVLLCTATLLLLLLLPLLGREGYQGRERLTSNTTNEIKTPNEVGATIRYAG